MSDKCKCEICRVCDGNGFVFWSIGGQFRGSYRSDDLDEMEECEECGGKGVDYVCAYCLYEDVA